MHFWKAKLWCPSNTKLSWWPEKVCSGKSNQGNYSKTDAGGNIQCICSELTVTQSSNQW